MKRAAGENGPDGLDQRRVRHRSRRTPPGRRVGRRWGAVAVDRGPRGAPDPAHAGQPEAVPLPGEVVRLIASTSAGSKGANHAPPALRSWLPAARVRAASRPGGPSADRSPAPRRWSAGWPGQARGLKTRGGKKGFAPARERCRRHAQRARHQLQLLAPKQAQHRLALALPRHPPASAQAYRIRVRRRLCCHAHHPCPRIPSAYGVSQSIVGGGLAGRVIVFESRRSGARACSAPCRSHPSGSTCSTWCMAFARRSGAARPRCCCGRGAA